MDLIDDLIARARRWAVEPGGADPVPDIEAALRACEGDQDRARLHAARASALQGTDHVLAADDMLIAAECFRRADRTADAAACTAGAATLVQMTGDWGRALELAVAATRQLADVELDDTQSLRAAAALCAFYGHLGAFDLAAPFGADVGQDDDVGVGRPAQQRECAGRSWREHVAQAVGPVGGGQRRPAAGVVAGLGSSGL